MCAYAEPIKLEPSFSRDLISIDLVHCQSILGTSYTLNPYSVLEVMSTDLITYLNLIATYGEIPPDKDISSSIIDERAKFILLGKSDLLNTYIAAVDNVFNSLEGSPMAREVFEAYIVEAITRQCGRACAEFFDVFKANNAKFASTLPSGLSQVTARSMLYNFMEYIEKHAEGGATAENFKKYSTVSRLTFDEANIAKNYDILSEFNTDGGFYTGFGASENLDGARDQYKRFFQSFNDAAVKYSQN